MLDYESSKSLLLFQTWQQALERSGAAIKRASTNPTQARCTLGHRLQPGEIKRHMGECDTTPSGHVETVSGQIDTIVIAMHAFCSCITFFGLIKVFENRHVITTHRTPSLDVCALCVLLDSNSRRTQTSHSHPQEIP